MDVTKNGWRWIGGTLGVLTIWVIARETKAPLSEWWLLIWEAAFSAGFFSRTIWKHVTKQKPGAS